MLLISLVSLLFILGANEASDECIPVPIACKSNELSDAFPQTEEEFDVVCQQLIGYMECGIKIEEKCHFDLEILPVVRYVLGVAHEACDKDSQLHKDIVGNIECVHNLYQNYSGQCREWLPSEESMKMHRQSLLAEGLDYIDENEDEPHICFRVLYVLACEALRIDDGCGSVAMNAAVDLTIKLSSVVIDGCTDEIAKYLPAVVRIIKLEKEEAAELENTQRKKK